jgi:hypothetical protein
VDNAPKKLHSFTEQLTYSHSMSAAPWWEAVYRKAFGQLASMADIREDGWSQRSGVDRIVVLKSGKIIKIDEKVARSVYPTLPLERWSSIEDRTPGWVQKPIDADFIAYAEAPTGEVYLLPVQLLQRAWRTIGKTKWVKLYPSLHVKNIGYTTIIVPVPKSEVFRAIQDAILVQHDPIGAT